MRFARVTEPKYNNNQAADRNANATVVLGGRTDHIICLLLCQKKKGLITGWYLSAAVLFIRLAAPNVLQKMINCNSFCCNDTFECTITINNVHRQVCMPQGT